MAASATGVHGEATLGEETPARPAFVVGQAGTGSATPALRGVLRTAVSSLLAWLSSAPGLSYRVTGDLPSVGRHEVVYRGGHHRVFRLGILLLLSKTHVLKLTSTKV